MDPAAAAAVPTPRPLLVLFADDDEAMRSLVADCLSSRGHQVEVAGDGDEAMARLAQIHPDVIVTDLRMPHGGLAWLERLRRAVPGVPVVVLSAFAAAAAPAGLAEPGAGGAESRPLGVAAWLSKPVTMSELAAAVNRVARAARAA